MRYLSAVIITVVLLFASVQACEWQGELDRILDESAALYQTLDALNALNDRCPAQPRILLEQGDVLFHLRHYEEASALWRQVLEQHELPDAVAIKVRLRVLDAEKQAANRRRHQLIMRSTTRWDALDQDLTLDWSTQGIMTYGMSAVPLFGQPMFSSFYVKYGALLRQHVQQSTDETYITLSTGFNNRYQALALPFGLGWESTTGQSNVFLTSKPAIRWLGLQWSDDIEWVISSGLWTHKPAVRWSSNHRSAGVNAQWSQQWQTLSASAKIGDQWQLGVNGDYDLNASAHELGLTLQVKPLDALSIRLSADTNPSQWQQWSTALSFSWDMH